MTTKSTDDYTFLYISLKLTQTVNRVANQELLLAMHLTQHTQQYITQVDRSKSIRTYLRYIYKHRRVDNCSDYIALSTRTQ